MANENQTLINTYQTDGIDGVKILFGLDEDSNIVLQCYGDFNNTENSTFIDNFFNYVSDSQTSLSFLDSVSNIADNNTLRESIGVINFASNLVEDYNESVANGYSETVAKWHTSFETALKWAVSDTTSAYGAASGLGAGAIYCSPVALTGLGYAGCVALYGTIGYVMADYIGENAVELLTDIGDMVYSSYSQNNTLLHQAIDSLGNSVSITSDGVLLVDILDKPIDLTYAISLFEGYNSIINDINSSSSLSTPINNLDSISFTTTDTNGNSTTETYIVQSGDTLYDIAEAAGTTVEAIYAANSWLTEEGRVSEDGKYCLIKSGEQISIPLSEITQSVTVNNDDGSLYIFNFEDSILNLYSFTNGWSTVSLNDIDIGSYKLNIDYDALLKQALGLGNYGNYDGTSTIDNSLFDLKINIGLDSNNATKDPNDFTTGSAIAGGDYSGDMPIDVINGDGLTNTSISQLVTDDYRPGAETLADKNVQNLIDRTVQYLDNTFVKPVQDLASDVWNGVKNVFSSITNLFTEAPKVENVDPLVLDLNNNGIELISFENSKVSFDVDGDGYKENTGWVSGTDGIVVHDKNGDGVINDITETISEYYTDNVSDGLEALATLDSNSDGVFDSKDTMWKTLRVWVDANEDGISTSSELHTFEELGIVSINLNKTESYRERIEGNPVLSRSSMTMSDGTTQEVAAVDFTTNPIGYEWNDVYEDGSVISSEDGLSSSYVVTGSDGAIVDLNAEGVNSAYGNIGNDTLIGDDGDNWLMGGKGSDTLIGGAGDDLLIIDTEDLNANIDGGDGTDIIKVVDSENVGIYFNMSVSHVEVINSGDGNDILIGGGNSNVFMSGGGGDDVMIGGAADDALAGEDGNDYIDGGYGDDILRGHRGEDYLIGGEGNDYMEGGLGDDTLLGGVGDDILIGDEGNDTIDGGDGFDMVEYSGSYDQYTFSQDTNGVITVTDTTDGSVDTITNVERLRFDSVDVNLGDAGSLPLPVKDEITISGTGTIIIDPANLLANDYSTSRKKISIKEITDVVGGTAYIREDGMIVFTPNVYFTGTMSFDYSIQDEDGGYTTIYRENTDGTITTAPLRAQVTLVDNNDPTDPLYSEQWYLSEIKVKKAWEDYTGEGIKIGIFEGEVENPFNHLHSDLDDNVSQEYLDWFLEDEVDEYSNHATLVAGVIAAERNGEGSVGIAYNSEISSYTWGTDANGLQNMMYCDIANNSWGFTTLFGDNFDKDIYSQVIVAEIAMENAAEYGRNGLGTAMVYAAGNSGNEGDNVNYHNMQNSRLGITVGSINQEGDLSTLVEATDPFSSPGSAILVSAPGSNVESTSNIIETDNGSTFGSDYEMTEGTSYSAPIVSGIIALMMEANSKLGYRDIQQILAYSARIFDDGDTVWKYNGSTYWNGSGMHYSSDYGYGIVDAYAAVRLAETWTEINTSINELSVTGENDNSTTLVDNGTITSSINLESNIIVQSVEVSLNIDHTNIGDLIISIISPDGTESVLVDRAGKATDSDNTDLGLTDDNLTFTFSSTNFLGESGTGEWTLKVTDANTGETGTLNDWSITLYGSENDGNNTYIFTDEFDEFSTSDITIQDLEGIDTINASTLLTDSIIDLRKDTTSVIDGRNVKFGITSGSDYLTEKYEELSEKESERDSLQITLDSKTSELSALETELAEKTATKNQMVSDGNAVTKSELSAKLAEYTVAKNTCDANYATYKALSDDWSRYVFMTSSGPYANCPAYLREYFYILDGKDTVVFTYAEKEARINAINNAGDIYNASAAVANQLATEYNNLADSYNNYYTTLSELNNEIEDLNEQISALDDSIFSYENQISLLESQINTINKQIQSYEDGETVIENVYTGDGNDTIIGNEYDNTLYAGRGENTITGGEGSDTFEIQPNEDNIDIITDFECGVDKIDLTRFEINNFNNLNIAQVNNDVVIYFDDNQKVILQNVNISDITASDFEGFIDNSNILTGTDSGDNLYGDSRDDTIDGSSGNDYISGGTGDNVLTGGTGSDLFFISVNSAKQDVITDFDVSDLNERIILTNFTSIKDFDDLNIIQSGDNVIITFDNNQKLVIKNVNISDLSNDNFIFYQQAIGTTEEDTIAMTDENLIAYAGDGDDKVYGNDSANYIVLGKGNDYVSAGKGNDTIYGNEGNDTIYGNEGNDTIYAGDGDDKIYLDAGNDTVYGGSGNNQFFIFNNSETTSTIKDFDASKDVINLQYIDGVDSIQDVEIVQDGNNTLLKFDNNQVICLENVNSEDITSSNFKSSTATTITRDESGNILGTIGNDYIVAENNTTGETIFANDGNDKIYGGSSNDTILGEGGDDIIYGKAGNDLLQGGDGNDTIYGGIGQNVLYGEGGKDTFVIEKRSFLELQKSTLQYDFIGDFDLINDKIDLSQFTNVKSFSDLKIYQGANGEDAYIMLPNYIGSFSGHNQIIVLKDTNVEDITENIFINLNNPANLKNDTAIVKEDNSVIIDILSNDTDDKGTIDINDITINEAKHGTIVKNSDGTITYTPNANYNGTDSFTYTFTDNGGNTSTATVNINVSSINDNPVANIQNIISLNTNKLTIDVLVGATDADGDTTSIFSVEDGEYGTTSIVNGKIVYTPTAEYTGTDSFKYVISDGKGGFTTQTLSIGGLKITEDTATIINLDDYLSSNEITIESVSNSANATVTINSEGKVIYTPNANYYGEDSFEITVKNSNGETETKTINLEVTNVDDKPVVNGDINDVVLPASKEFRISLNTSLFNEVDGENLTFSIKNASGTLPTWINYDSETNEIYGTTPTTNSSTNIDFIATDENGNSSTIEFSFKVNKSILVFDDNDNYIESGSASLTIYAYGGNDTIILSGSSSIVYAGDGDDTIKTGSGSDTIDAGNGNDTITGGEGADTFIISKNAGDIDTITDLEIYDSIKLEGFGQNVKLKDFSYIQNGSNLEFDLGDGQKLILKNTTIEEFNIFKPDTKIITRYSSYEGTSDAEKVIISGDGYIYNTNGGNDVVIAYDQRSVYSVGNTINTGSGDDTIVGSTGHDILNGGEGNDIYYLTSSGSNIIQIDKNSGDNDIIYNFLWYESIQLVGFEDNDIRNYTAVQNGNDTIIYLEDSQTLTIKDFPVDCVDYISQCTNIFCSADSNVVGTDGNDMIRSYENNTVASKVINAGKGNDVIFGRHDQANQYIIEQNSDEFDTIFSTNKYDKIFLKGFDSSIINNENFLNEVSYYNNTDGVILNLGNGQSVLVVNFSYYSYNTDLNLLNMLLFDNKYGTENNDTITGSNYEETLYGLAGDDTITGNSSLATTIYAGDGDDTLITAHDNDILFGENGIDTFIIKNNKIIIEDFDPSTEIIDIKYFKYIFEYSNLTVSQSGDDTIISFTNNGENISMTLLNVLADQLNAGNFTFYKIEGTSGNDNIIDTYSGDNTIYGYESSDLITAGAGNDTLYGGDGTDILIANQGNDTLNGDDGYDIFVIKNDTLITTIEDFDVASKKEIIDITDILNNNSDIVYFEDLNITQSGNDTIIEFSDTQKIILKNVDSSDLDVRNFEGLSIHVGDTQYANNIYFTSNSDKIEDLYDYNLNEDFGTNIHLGDGDDILNTGGSYDYYNLVTIHGDNGNDIISFNGTNSAIYGDEGDDEITLKGNANNNIIYGGNGSDKFIFQYLVSCNSTLIKDFDYTNTNEKIVIESATITSFDDLNITSTSEGTLIKYDDSEILLEGVDSSSITADNFEIKTVLVGDDTIDDNFIDYTSSQIIYSYGGSDYIEGSEFDDRIYSGDSAFYTDSLLNYEFNLNDNDTIYAKGGNDYIDVATGDDIVYAGDGNDEISTTIYSFIKSTRELYGEEGDDTISSIGSSDSIIDGGNGNDYIKISDTVDSYIYGGAGNDIIILDIDSSINGNSAIEYSTQTSNIVNAGDGDDIIYTSTNDNIDLGSGNDKLYFYYTDIWSYVFDDDGIATDYCPTRYYSSATVKGGEGNDTYFISDGEDSTITIQDFEVNNINERIDLQNTSINSFEDLVISDDGNGNSIISLGNNYDLVLENVSASDLTENNFIFKLTGTTGNDILVGENNVIFGGEGDDTLISKDSAISTGGNGQDTFIIRENSTTNGETVITDFENGTDKISISNLLANSFDELIILYKEPDTYTYTLTSAYENSDRKFLENVTAQEMLSYSSILYRIFGDPILYNAEIYLANGQKIIVENIAKDSLTASDFNFISDQLYSIDNYETTINEDTKTQIDVVSEIKNLNPDSDITLINVSNSSNGTVEIVDNKIEYTPNTNFNGTDTISYTVSDIYGNISTNSITITVNSVNDAPTATITTAITNEDNSVILDVLANATDVDGDTLSINSVINGSHGTVTIVDDVNGNKVIQYSPNSNYYGTDTITYTISDGNGGEVTKTVSIKINSVNDAPIATITTATTDEDNTVTIDVLAGATDAENDTISIQSFTQGNKGSIELINGKLVYTPYSDMNGTDNITYTLSDGKGGITVQSLTININSVNDLPIATLENAVVKEDNSITLSPLSGTFDLDSSSITLQSVGNAVHGVIIQNADGTITYTPNANYYGSDSFTYSIIDSDGGVTEKTVTLTIVSVNDNPVATIDSISTNEDENVIIDVLAGAGDIDSDIISIKSVTNGSHGTATIVEDENGNQTIQYTPNENYNGTDTITYTISDGNGGETTKTLTVNINSVNDDPIVNDDSASVNEDNSVIINVLENDRDIEDVLGYSNINIVDQPVFGNIVINNDGTITYTPNENYNGNDYFTYSITDSDGITKEAKVNITVNSINDTPVAIITKANTTEDNSVTIDVVNGSYDTDGDNISLVSVTNGTKGTTSIIDGKIVYTPNSGENGHDTFEYIISDGTVEVKQSINIDIEGKDPVAINTIKESNLNEDSNIVLNILDQYADLGLNLTSDNISVGHAENGEVQINDDGSITYTPNVNYYGNDSFTFIIVKDGELKDVGSFNLTINSVNDAPVINLDSVTTNEDNPLLIDVLANSTDVENDSINIVSVSNVSNGTIEIIDGKILYTPNKDFNGTDSFEVTISDSNGAETTKTVNITVNSVNDVPVATITTATTNEDNTVTIDVLANASDVDGDSLTIKEVSNGSHGTASIIEDTNGDKVIQYVPTANFNGTDTITYTITDGNGGETTKSISIVVNSVNDTPIATDDSISLNEDSTVIINALNNDTDIEDELSSYNKENINIVAAAAFGVVVLNADGSFAYTPNSNFNGNDSFTYNIIDSDGAVSNTATVHINVNPVNDAPTISGDVTEQEAFVGEYFECNLNDYFTFSDIDGDSLELSVKLADGSDLPSWLTFDSDTGILSGTADDSISAGLLDLNIVASDGNLEATNSFNLMVSKEIEANQALLDRINIIDIQDIDGIFRGNSGEMDIIRSGTGDDIIEYNQDSSWTQSNYTALNVYSNDRLELIGLNRTDDAFDGGSGADTLNLTSGNDAIFLDDDYTDNPSANGNRLNSIEIINGEDGNDIIDLSSLKYSYGNVELNGGNGNDVLWSNDGDDTLNGGSGNDNIQSGRGDDILNGDSGNDILKGYDGDDTINGGEGVDKMWGGNGNDIFQFDSLEDSRIDSSDVNSSITMDTIYDFTQGQDIIEFDSSLGFDSIAFEGADGSTLGYYHENGNTIIRNGDNDFSIKLIGEFDLKSDDFGF